MHIPVAHSGVNVKDLHPKLRARLAAFFADPRIAGKVTVISGVRSYQQQKALYAKYKAGRGNLAANPDRKLSNGFQGSYHMGQPAFDNYGYAVDFRILGNRISTRDVNRIAEEYGLVKTVRSEWWHHQASRVQNGKMVWFPTTQASIPKAVSVKSDQQKALEFIAAAVKTVVRQGDRGPVVELLQKLLDKNGYKLTKKPRRNAGIDGVYGKMTTGAVRQFQKDENLVQDGICGPNTWAALTS